MRQSNHPKITVGRLARPYGVRGWIKLISYTDPPENLLHYPTWQIQLDQEWRPITVEASRTHGKFLVVKLAGCDTPEAARQYTNAFIAVDRDELPALTKGEYYWADLIGLRVVTVTGDDLGRVDSLLETGANDVLIVKNHRERWIPYVKAVIQSIDLAHKIITVDWDPEF